MTIIKHSDIKAKLESLPYPGVKIKVEGDKAHLTVTGQKKVAMVFAETIKNLGSKRSQYVDYFQLRKESIQNILKGDFLGKYKTVEDY